MRAINIQQDMTISEKLKILTDAAKYDVACTSSGVDRSNKGKGMGDAHACGKTGGIGQASEAVQGLSAQQHQRHALEEIS